MSDTLLSLPGVGPSIAKDLTDLGFRETGELRDADPQKMYEDLCTLRGTHVDRCVLYVFRSIVYFAGHPASQAKDLKWWHWKDGREE